MEASIPARGSYAVLFKAFAFDDFTMRRLAHVVAAAPSGDVFLMIDETNRPAGPIAFDRLLRYRESDVVALGFPQIAQGSLFWYNADYPLYYFQHLEPDYDVVVMVEYDAVPIIDLDVLVQRFIDEKLDFVGHQLAEMQATYWWTNTMLRFYTPAQVRPYQVCAAVFSQRAIRHLAECRVRHAASGVSDQKEWPIGEAFVGTELVAAGFPVRELAYFGELTRYDWWPPIHERELADCTGEAFVHPVLAGRRYVKSLFKSGYLSGVIVCAKLIAATVVRRASRQHSDRIARYRSVDGDVPHIVLNNAARHIATDEGEA